VSAIVTDDGCRQGILAFGDSITNGGGELQFGLALQSWVQWLSRAVGLPFTNYAFDGARASDLVAHQIPAHVRINAVTDARYQLGCLYIGVNDVRSPDWDRLAYERDLDTALSYLTERCDRVLTATIPLRLGRPPADGKVPEANAIIERRAAATGALIVDLRDFGGRRVLMVDRVHPTAFGQVEIAERALAVLGAHGFATPFRPASELAYHRPSRRTLVRTELRYARRYLWDGFTLWRDARLAQ
jgi:lysophospholipase L1-like esterase